MEDCAIRNQLCTLMGWPRIDCLDIVYVSSKL